MTTSSHKNYNINTLRGLTNDDDMDVCETLGIDSRHAYKPSIIKAQLDRDVPVEKHPEIKNMLRKYLSKREWEEVEE